MEALVDHAFERACQPPGQRPEPGVITKELRLLAGDDRDAVHRAWDCCVQRYADQEQLAWLRAATYLLPLEMELQHERVESCRASSDRRTGDRRTGEVASRQPRVRAPRDATDRAVAPTRADRPGVAPGSRRFREEPPR